MKIGIDLTVCHVNQAGTGIYASRLAEALRRREGTCGDTFVFFSAGQQQNMAVRSVASRLRTLYRDLVWLQVLLPAKARRAGVDVLHAPAGIGPLRAHCPVVVSIHDMVPMRMPHALPAWQRRYSSLMMPRSARSAARIVTGSHHAKQEIVALLGEPAEKITVAYDAASPDFMLLPAAQVAVVRAQYGLDAPFLLCVGTLEPRKNLVRLVEACALLRDRGVRCPLVHAGLVGWGTAMANAVSRYGLEDQVRFLGRLPLAHLVALYNAAHVMVYPSLYEGFGLPVVEAMACGCPVVTSNVTSLPEVAGDAAVLVDPNGAESIADGVERVLRDEALRCQMRERGLTRAASFSWDRCAAETVRVYHDAADCK